ncbi:MAG: threonylcarbamoyl-AMP synthase [Parachlamydiaceae bacterium]|nr:threonylcarbamoyl-AMP synthase [Parachlamydiaceae bacterium]
MLITLEQAAKSIINGGVVAVPTETVYGLAASLTSESAINEVFRLKGRPSENPLIIHVSALSQIESIASAIPADFDKLASKFWPGPMTIVLPINADAVPAVARANLSTAAFRIPNHTLALKLIELAGPLVMPSANLSGRPSATTPEHVEIDFGRSFPVLDGGKCSRGLESTIVIFIEDQWHIIRLGSLSANDFLPVLGYAPTYLQKKTDAKPLCPGQLYRHYAPKAKLTMKTTFDENFQGVIVGFSDRVYPKGASLIYLGSSREPLTVAENLYSVLRNLDAFGITSAFVDCNYPQEGLWVTISERLSKASSCPDRG